MKLDRELRRRRWQKDAGERLEIRPHPEGFAVWYVRAEGAQIVGQPQPTYEDAEIHVQLTDLELRAFYNPRRSRRYAHRSPIARRSRRPHRARRPLRDSRPCLPRRKPLDLRPEDPPRDPAH